MSNDEDSRKEIIELGGVKKMVEMLSSKNKQVVKNATGALLNLANEEEAWPQIRESGGVELLLDILKNNKDQLREYAAGVFVNLANDAETRKIFHENGGVKIMTELLESDNEEMIRCAVGTFVALAAEPSICVQLRDLGAYDLIVGALKSEDEDILARTTGCLWNLAVDGEESIEMLIETGCVKKLAKLIKKTEDPEVIGNTVTVLSMLGGNPEVSEYLREKEILKHIIKGLGHDDERVRQNCVAAVWNLAHVEANKDPMKDLGAVQGMIDLLDSEDEETLWKTLGAVITMGSHEGTSREFRESEGIDKLIPLIENQENERVCLYALIAIAVLAYEDDNKDAIREAGAFGPIIDLLNCENESLIEKACASLLNLSLNDQNRVVVRQLDGIAPLIELLYHHNPNIQQNAAGVLWNLSNDPKNKKVIRELGGLNALLTLIGGGSVEPQNKKIPRMKDRGGMDSGSESDSDVKKKRAAISDSDSDSDFEIPGKKKGKKTDTIKDLTKYAQGIRSRLDDGDDELNERLTDKERELLYNATQDVLEWLAEHPNASKKDLKAQKKDLDEKVNPIIDRADAQNELSEYASNLKRKMQDDDELLGILTSKEAKKISQTADDILDWLAENPRPKKEDIDAKKGDAVQIVDPILSRADALISLNNYASNTKKRINDDDDLGSYLTKKEKKLIDDATQELMDWILENPHADKETIEQKRKELLDKIDPILSRSDAQKSLKDYAEKIHKRVNDDDDCLSQLVPKEKKKVNRETDDILEWLEENKKATKGEIDDKTKEYQDFVKPIIEKAEAKDDLSKYAKQLKERIDDDDDLGAYLTAKEKKKVKEISNDILDFLEDNPKATAEEIRQKKADASKELQPILERGEAKRNLKEKIESLQTRMNNSDDILSEITSKDKKLLDKTIQEVNDWLEENELAKTEQYNEKGKYLDSVAIPIIEKTEARKELEATAMNYQDALSDPEINKRLTDTEKAKVKRSIEESMDWLDDHEDCTKKEANEQTKKMKDICDPIIKRAEAMKLLDETLSDLKNKASNPSVVKRLTEQEKKNFEKTLNDVQDWMNVNEKKHQEESENPILERPSALRELDEFAKSILSRTKDSDDLGEFLSKSDLKTVKQTSSDLMSWIEDNIDADKQTIDAKKKEYKAIIDPIIEKANSRKEFSDYGEKLKERISNDDDLGCFIASKDKKKIKKDFDELIDFLEENPDLSLDETNKKQNEFKQNYDSIISTATSKRELTNDIELVKKRMNNDEDIGLFLSKSEKKILSDKSKELLDFLEQNPDATKDQVENKKKEINQLSESYFKKAETMKKLNDHVNDCKKRVNDKNDIGGLISTSDKKIVEKSCDETVAWVKTHLDSDISEIESKQQSFNKEVDPIISKESNKQKLLQYVADSDKRMNDELSSFATKGDKELVKKTRKDVEDWMKKNADADAKTVLKKKQEVETVIKPVVSRCEAEKKLKDYAGSIKTRMEKDDVARYLSIDEKKKLKQLSDDALNWLEENPGLSRSLLVEKKEELQKKVETMLSDDHKGKSVQNEINKLRKRILKDDDLGDILSIGDKTQIRDLASDLQDWLIQNPNATQEEIDAKKKELDEQVADVVKKAKEKKKLRDMAKGLKKRMADDDDSLSALGIKEKQDLTRYTDELLDWLENNPNATPEEIAAKEKELMEKLKPIETKAKKKKQLRDVGKGLKKRAEDEDDLGPFLSVKEKQLIAKANQEFLDWLAANPNATEAEIEAKRKEIFKEVDEIVKRANKKKQLRDQGNGLKKRAEDEDDLGPYLSVKEKKMIEKANQEFLDWLAANPNATEAEIEAMRNKIFKEVDKIIEKASAKKRLNDYSKSLKKRLSDDDDSLNALGTKDRAIAKKALDDLLDWLEKNPNATAEEIAAKEKEFMDIMNALESKAKSRKKLRDLANGLKKRMADDDDSLSALSVAERQKLQKEIDDLIKWLEENPDAPRELIEQKLKELEDKLKLLESKGGQRKDLDSFARELKKKITDEDDIGRFLSSKTQKKVGESVDDLLDWLESNPNASAEEISSKRKEFDSKVIPMITRAEKLKNLEDYAQKLQTDIDRNQHVAEYMSSEDKVKVSSEIDKVLTWIDKNKEAEEKEIDQRDSQFRNAINPVVVVAEKKLLTDYAHDMKERIANKDDLGMFAQDEKTRDAPDQFLDYLKTSSDNKKELDEKKEEFKSLMDPLKKKKQLRDYAKGLKKRLSDDDDALSSLGTKEKKLIEKLSDEFLDWLEKNPNATAEEIAAKEKEFMEKMCALESKAKSRKKLRDMATGLKKRMDDDEDALSKLGVKEKKSLQKRIDELIQWLAENPDASKEEIEAKRKELYEMMKLLEEKATTRKLLDDYARDLKKKVEDDNDLGRFLKKKEKKKVISATDDLLEWLEKNPDATKEEMESELNKTKIGIEDVINRAQTIKDLDDYGKELKKNIENNEEIAVYLSSDEKKQILKEVGDLTKWVDENTKADLETILTKKNEFEEKVNPSLSNAEKKRLAHMANELNKRIEDKDDLKLVLNKREKKNLKKSSDDLLDWLEKNQQADKKTVNEKKQEFLDSTKPIISEAEKKKELSEICSFMNDIERSKYEQETDDSLNWLKKNRSAKKVEVEFQHLDLDDNVDDALGKAKVKKDISDLVHDAQKSANDDLSIFMSKGDKSVLDDLVEDTDEWLSKNRDANKSELLKKKEELIKKVDPIVNKAKSKKHVKEYENSLKKRIEDKEDLGQFVSDKEKKKIEKSISDLLGWLESSNKPSKQEIDKKVEDMEKENSEIIARAELIKSLDVDTKSAKQRINDSKDLAPYVRSKDQSKTNKKIDSMLDWIEENKDASKEKIEEKKEEFAESIQSTIDNAEAKKKLDLFAKNVRDRMQDKNDILSKLSSKDQKKINKEIDTNIEWIEENEKATKEETNEQLTEFTEFLKPFLEKSEQVDSLFKLSKELQQRVDESEQNGFLEKKEKKKLSITEDIDQFLEENPKAKSSDIKEKKEEILKTLQPILDTYDSKKNLNEKIKRLKERLNNPDDSLSVISSSEKKKLKSLADDVSKWLDDNKDASKQEIEKKSNDFDNETKPIFESAEAKKALELDIQRYKDALSSSKKSKKNDGIAEVDDDSDEEKDKAAGEAEILQKKTQLEQNVKPALVRIEVVGKLDDYIRNLKDRMEDPSDLGGKIGKSDKKKIMKEIDSALDWLSENSNASNDEFQKKTNELENLLGPLIDKAEATKKLNDYTNEIKKRLKDDSDALSKIPKKQKKKIEREIDDLLEWIQENETTKKEIEKKLEEFKATIEPMIAREESAQKLRDLSNTLRSRLADATDLSERIDDKNKKLISNAIHEALDWLEENPNATPDEIDKKTTTLDERTKKIIDRGDAQKALDDYTALVQARIADDSDHLFSQLSKKEQNIIKETTESVVKWTNKNIEADKKEINEKMREFNNIVGPLLERADAKEDLENTVKFCKEKARNPKIVARLPKKDKASIENEIKETYDWYSDPKNKEAPTKEFQKRAQDLQKKIQPALQRAEAVEILDSSARILKERVDNDLGPYLDKQDYETVSSACEDAINFLKDNEESTKKQIDDQKVVFDNKVQEIVKDAEARRDLDFLAQELKGRLDDDEKLTRNLSDKEKKVIQETTTDVIDWLESHPKATANEVKDKKRDLDEKVKQPLDRAEALNSFEEEIVQVKKRFNDGNDLGKMLNAEEKKQISKFIKDSEDWIAKNSSADIKTIDQQKNDVVSEIQPIVKKAEARFQLQDYVDGIKTKLDTDKKLENRIEKDDLKTIRDGIEEVNEFIKKNADSTPQQFERKRKEIEEKLQPIMNRAEATKDLAESVKNIQNQLDSDKEIIESLNKDEKKQIQNIISDVNNWLDKNQKATRREADQKQAELENTVNPIIKRSKNRKQLTQYGKDVELRMKEDPDMAKMISLQEKEFIDKKTEEAMKWIDSNPTATTYDITNKTDELKENVEPILSNAKARSEFSKYIEQVRIRAKNNKEMLVEDQHQIQVLADAQRDWLKENPNATEAQIIQQQQKFDDEVNPVFKASSKKASKERMKLQNLQKNIKAQLLTDEKLKGLNDKQKKKISDLSDQALAWLLEHPDATDEEIRAYIRTLQKKLGEESNNFKFSVWVVSSYGLGYGFSEYKQSDLEKIKKGSFAAQQTHFRSYLGEQDRIKKIEREAREKGTKVFVDAKNELIKDDTTTVKLKETHSKKRSESVFSKPLSKEEEELEKKFAQLKTDKKVIGANLDALVNSAKSSGQVSSESIVQKEEDYPIVPYEKLKRRVTDNIIFPDFINVSQREMYLDPKEFKKLFKMERSDYLTLPAWKKKKLKMDLDLWD